MSDQTEITMRQDKKGRPVLEIPAKALLLAMGLAGGGFGDHILNKPEVSAEQFRDLSSQVRKIESDVTDIKTQLAMLRGEWRGKFEEKGTQ